MASALSRALKGLGNSLGFSGTDRSAPPGIDLTRESTPVNDLTQYARYGSALIFEPLADGWVTATYDIDTVIAGQVAINRTWDTQVSGGFGISQNSLDNMMCWIYGVTMNAVADTAIVDIGISRVTVIIPRGIGDVAGGSAQHALWYNLGVAAGSFIQTGTLQVNLFNNRNQTLIPHPWPAGHDLTIRVNQVNANAIAWRTSILCRILPFGVPPI